jgi:hypothetical protein
VRGTKLNVDLGYGISLRKARRAAGDLSMGAMCMLDLWELKDRAGAPGAQPPPTGSEDAGRPRAGFWRRLFSRGPVS